MLHILGGGLTRLGRPEFPAPLLCALALRVMVHPTEADRGHELEARLLAEDGAPVARLDIAFELGPVGAARPGEELSAAFALPLYTVAIPHAGAYSFELLIDGVHQASIPFFVDRLEQTPDA